MGREGGAALEARRVTVILAMARGPGFPEGSPERRYELRVILDQRGCLRNPASRGHDPQREINGACDLYVAPLQQAPGQRDPSTWDHRCIESIFQTGAAMFLDLGFGDTDVNPSVLNT